MIKLQQNETSRKLVSLLIFQSNETENPWAGASMWMIKKIDVDDVVDSKADTPDGDNYDWLTRAKRELVNAFNFKVTALKAKAILDNIDFPMAEATNYSRSDIIAMRN